MSYTIQHDARGHVSKPVSWWLVIAILILAVSAFICAAFYIGHRIGFASAEKPVVLTKACPPPVQTTRWVCDSAEMREYRNVCLRRAKGVHQ